MSHGIIESFRELLGIESPSKKTADVFRASFASIDELSAATREEPADPAAEEWVWVEGYKGTCSDMTCNGYQYELGKRFDMPGDAKIVACSTGFHLCLEMHHVFRYYHRGGGNRFFRVKALVRKTDLDHYGTLGLVYVHDKLVAKSIEFVSELTADEILYEDEYKNWTKAEKKRALKEGIDAVLKQRQIAPLVKLGYSRPFAEYIVAKGKADVAMAVGSQADLSMDMKVLAIMQM